MKLNKSKALLITHLYGQMADVRTIKKFCDEQNIYLIESNRIVLLGEIFY